MCWPPNYPSYDQNLYAANYSEYSSDPSLPLFNRALQGLYTPGSTFKPAVAVVATGQRPHQPVFYRLLQRRVQLLQDYHPAVPAMATAATSMW